MYKCYFYNSNDVGRGDMAKPIFYTSAFFFLLFSFLFLSYLQFLPFLFLCGMAEGGVRVCRCLSGHTSAMGMGNSSRILFSSPLPLSAADFSPL